MLKRREILWDPMPVPQVVAFYLGIPLVMSVLFSINHAGLARHLSILEGIPYWAGIWVTFWLMLDVATRASAVALRPWSPPLWLTLLLGAALAMLISRPVIVWYIGNYVAGLPPGTYQPVADFGDAWRELDRALSFAGTPAFWITVNYYYDRVLGIPRYRGRLTELNAGGAANPVGVISPPSAAAESSFNTNTESARALAQPEEGASRGTDGTPTLEESRTPPTASGLTGAGTLLSLVPVAVGADVIALRAEDHYVRVYTTQGSALVRYRFGDALRELEPLGGIQVHRSFWVRRSHIAQLDRNGEQWRVVLSNGERVPVSQGYRGAVRALQLPEVAPRRADLALSERTYPRLR